MEDLHNNKEGKKPIDLLYEEKSSLNKNLRSLKKDLGYESEYMMFLFANKEESQEVKKEGLDKIDKEFNAEPEVMELKNKISQIEIAINEIDNNEQQERINAFPALKQESLLKIENLKNLYQDQYDRYDAKRKEFELAIENAIAPGVELGMTREVAMRNYPVNVNTSLLGRIKYINNILADVILELEMVSENVKDLDENNMYTLGDISSTRFILRDVKDESFEREVSYIERDLNNKNTY